MMRILFHYSIFIFRIVGIIMLISSILNACGTTREQELSVSVTQTLPSKTSDVSYVPVKTMQPTKIPTLLPTLTPSPSPFLKGRIAFLSRRTDSWGLYLMNISCISPTEKCKNDVTLLVDNMYINEQAPPTWSPDGKQIAFTAWDKKSFRQVYRINDDGGGLTQVTHTDNQHFYATWSPDGKQIAFGSTKIIQVINTEGKVLASFENDSALHYTYLVWSPDSTHLAFENEERFGHYTSGVLAVDGSESFLIAIPNTSEVERFYQDPVWSPDGKRVAFQYKGDIYITNADGSNVIPLTNDPAVFQRNPVWSPDGKQIAFESLIYPSDKTAGCLSYFDYSITNLRCDWEIYIMNVDGSGQINLTDNPNWDSSPIWSPDGNYIVFVSAQNEHDPDKCYIKSLCNWDIYVMTSDGNNVTQLTNNPGEDVWPVWAFSNLQSN